MTIVFKLSDNLKDKVIKHYQDMFKEKTPPYAVFQAQEMDGTVITLYESGKIMFQGVSADIDANLWIDMEKHLNNRVIDITTGKDKKTSDKKDKYDEKPIINKPSIGSDEVGTGDYFGPIIVTASFVSKENEQFLIDLGVKDSKKITDEKIIEIAPKIIEKIPHSTLIFDNESYNKFHTDDINMNKIKAILHNKVLLNLIKSEYPYEQIIIDQFTPEAKYYEYIKDAKEIVRNISFYTQAEDKFLCVAASSIISRYIFLKKMNELSKEIGFNLPKGASDKVDEAAKEIVKKYGFEKLNHIAKLNFKNTEKIKDNQ
ncbi:MAG: ribonuclease HIII [Bacilli bacterium]|nr:ribonuclease HIII [Bacilli bacterium]